jgi:hypothetical protein
MVALPFYNAVFGIWVAEWWPTSSIPSTPTIQPSNRIYSLATEDSGSRREIRIFWSIMIKLRQGTLCSPAVILVFVIMRGSNPIKYATTAFHDTDGIEYNIVHSDRDRGFVLIDTEGWDTIQKNAREGYDVEAEVLFGIFSNKPYFINTVELTNLQSLGNLISQPTHRSHK